MLVYDEMAFMVVNKKQKILIVEKKKTLNQFYYKTSFYIKNNYFLFVTVQEKNWVQKSQFNSKGYDLCKIWDFMTINFIMKKAILWNPAFTTKFIFLQKNIKISNWFF